MASVSWRRWWMYLKLSFLPRLYFKPDKQERLRRYLRALLYLFNVHTLFLGGIACLCVYVCDRFRFSYNMDLTLVSTGITFPLIFNIQQAFTRREKALTLIANLKASAVSLYFMHRDWAQDDNFPASLGNDHSAAALHCKMLLMDLLRDVRKYLVAHSRYESYAEQRLAAKHNPYVNMLLADMSLSGASQLSFEAAVERYQKTDPATAALHRCYRGFSRLSVLNERLGLRSGYTKGGEGGMSRTNQYLRYMIANLEELRMIREYRTPIMMRYANGVLIHIFSMALAPYFVHFCDSWQSLGYSRNSCPAGYSAAIVFTIICMLLYNVQQDIEQPFDMEGLDDVFFDVQDEVMDDVMSPMRTAAPSGFSTPRPPGPESYCSAAMCPCSPSMKAQHDPHVHAPWAAAAAAAMERGSGGGACGASKLSQQPSLLDPVDEDACEGTGFAAVGFAGTRSTMRRVSSKEVVNKQSLQQQIHEKHLTWGAAGSVASGCSTPLRGSSPPASQTGAMPCVGGAAETSRSCSREMAVLQNASSSSIDKLVPDHHDEMQHGAAAGSRQRNTPRDTAAAAAAAAVMSGSFTSMAAGPAAGRSSRSTIERGDVDGQQVVIGVAAGGPGPGDERISSASSGSAESSRLIKSAVYSSAEW